jgi:hypothetical protein
MNVSAALKPHTRTACCRASGGSPGVDPAYVPHGTESPGTARSAPTLAGVGALQGPGLGC